MNFLVFLEMTKEQRLELMNERSNLSVPEFKSRRRGSLKLMFFFFFTALDHTTVKLRTIISLVYDSFLQKETQNRSANYIWSSASTDGWNFRKTLWCASVKLIFIFIVRRGDQPNLALSSMIFRLFSHWDSYDGFSRNKKNLLIYISYAPLFAEREGGPTAHGHHAVDLESFDQWQSIHDSVQRFDEMSGRAGRLVSRWLRHAQFAHESPNDLLGRDRVPHRGDGADAHSHDAAEPQCRAIGIVRGVCHMRWGFGYWAVCFRGMSLIVRMRMITRLVVDNFALMNSLMFMLNAILSILI